MAEPRVEMTIFSILRSVYLLIPPSETFTRPRPVSPQAARDVSALAALKTSAFSFAGAVPGQDACQLERCQRGLCRSSGRCLASRFVLRAYEDLGSWRADGLRAARRGLYLGTSSQFFGHITGWGSVREPMLSGCRRGVWTHWFLFESNDLFFRMDWRIHSTRSLWAWSLFFR